ncbi:cell division protein FtsI [Planomonospora sp. ID67723]|uniref:penicillin-binding transpeptidase domain-containing protein n=1 Tax=Planomonospora sp. ID67723 TaxID=2738134 RepID=UPI0018C40269|nr:penicillin-binding transpeptidase domain-containing protein [Planomonospora sp. ID67723]MBG0832503.1 cell division protein FtsI [Planomonospora sp. ID67723]
MRSRPLLALIIIVLGIVGGSVYALTRPAQSGSRQPEAPGAEDTARAYLTAWEGSDLATMDRLAGGTPADFIERHVSFSEELDIESLSLTPGTIRLQGAQAAEMSFKGVRQVKGLGTWPFSSTLKLAVRDGRWRVVWSPETLHPALKDGGRLQLTETPGEKAEPVTRTGERFPRDNGAEDYLAELRADLPEEPSQGGYALEAVASDGRTRRLLGDDPQPAEHVRTTFSRPVQAAAARALDGVERPAAIVAVRSSTGEILAIADRLGGRHAFLGRYPAGSTFKVVTAAALLSAGLAPQSQVSCPESYSPPGGRPFRNASGTPSGSLTLTDAFAVSCNTAFIEQTVRALPGGGLVKAAELFGFNKPLKVPAASCVIEPHGDDNELASDAIGHNSVLASPLCMALAAAAVESGTWRQPAMTKRPKEREDEVPLPPAVAEGLRTMMRAAVATGTASAVPLPEGTAGKTGTATATGGGEHAWFIGYRDDVAFAVLVEDGGSGARSALPIAARFLRAL